MREKVEEGKYCEHVVEFYTEFDTLYSFMF